jgi:hypothetical protein
MEMELVCGGAKFWGFALHWFLFFFCVDVVGPSDGVKLLEVENKRWQPFEAKALLHYHVFCVFFQYNCFCCCCIESKNTQNVNYLIGLDINFQNIYLTQGLVIKELEVDRSLKA